LPKEVSERLEEDVHEIIEVKEKLGKETSISIRLNEMYYPKSAWAIIKLASNHSYYCTISNLVHSPIGWNKNS